MKPAILPKFLIGILLLLSVSVFGQTNQDKIKGNWKVYKYEVDKSINAPEKIINETIGTVFSFNNCVLIISKEENSKSGTYNVLGNKLTIGVDQSEAEIILLNNTQLQIKLPHRQGILYLSKG
jgi:hypothetical protein